jgi:hypothetical protein
MVALDLQEDRIIEMVWHTSNVIEMLNSSKYTLSISDEVSMFAAI